MTLLVSGEQGKESLARQGMLITLNVIPWSLVIVAPMAIQGRNFWKGKKSFFQSSLIRLQEGFLGWLSPRVKKKKINRRKASASTAGCMCEFIGGPPPINSSLVVPSLMWITKRETVLLFLSWSGEQHRTDCCLWLCWSHWAYRSYTSCGAFRKQQPRGCLLTLCCFCRSSVWDWYDGVVVGVWLLVHCFAAMTLSSVQWWNLYCCYW